MSQVTPRARAGSNRGKLTQHLCRHSPERHSQVLLWQSALLLLLCSSSITGPAVAAVNRRAMALMMLSFILADFTVGLDGKYLLGRIVRDSSQVIKTQRILVSAGVKHYIALCCSNAPLSITTLMAGL